MIQHSGWMHVSCAEKLNRQVSRGCGRILEDTTKRRSNKRKRQSVSQLTDEILQTIDERENPPSPAKESKHWSKNCKVSRNAKIVEVRKIY